MIKHLRGLTITLWIAALAACSAVIFQTHFVADLSAFMPRMPSERQQLLVEQLRDGIIGRLVMIGIEGGDPMERAQISQELANRLREKSAFMSVQNGDSHTQDMDREYFFKNRYLLSPAVTKERFTAAGMHDAISGSIDALSGGAGLMLKKLLPRDPTAETVQLLEQFSGDSQPRALHGVWASRDGERALLLAQLRSPGTDTEAQAQALDAIRQTFDQVRGSAADTRLVMSGTSVFAVSSRDTIETEVQRLAIASALLVIGFLLLVYRSLTLLLLGLLPVVSGALAGIAAVSLGFGHVHALTLGFGTTLIGEAVDYSIYLFVQGEGNAKNPRFWRTIRMGVITSITGFAALLFSGFPGLSQLGLYSIVGLITAALVTRYVLPLLKPTKIVLRDLTQAGELIDKVVSRASHLVWLVIALLIAATYIVWIQGGNIWNQQLSALSPIATAEQKLDMELRADLGAPDMRYIATFTAANEEAALQAAEKAGLVLNGFVKSGAIGGYNSPALVLPSQALQAARRSALPDEKTSRADLKQALLDLPIRAERLEGFVQDLQTTRNGSLLNRTDLKGSSAALLLDSLLIKRESNYLVLMPLRAVDGSADNMIDLSQLNSAMVNAGLTHVMLIDLLLETSSLFETYLHEAVTLASLGCLAIVVLLLLALRSVSRVLRVIIPLACAVLCVTAILLASSIQLTILHLVGLLLVVAVGSNYALFFDGSASDESDNQRRLKQTSLVIANLTTVGSFGLLGFSQVPVLSAIGSTVGPGAFLALIFSAVLARSRNHADRT